MHVYYINVPLHSSHSQLQQFAPQLVLLNLVLLARYSVISVLHVLPALQGVLSRLQDEGLDEGRQVGAAATEREDVVLLLLLGERQGQLGHLVQHGGQGHAQRGRLTAAQPQQH